APANVWQSAEGRLRVAQMANLCFVGRRSINRKSAKVLATVPSHVLICSARPPAALFTRQFEELVVETIKRVPCARGVPAHGSLACIAVLPARGIRNIKEYYSTPYDGTEPRKLNCLIADRSLGSEDAGRIWWSHRCTLPTDTNVRSRDCERRRARILSERCRLPRKCSLAPVRLDDCPVQLPRFHLAYSTVTDFARLRGWSTSVPMMTAV